MHSKLIPRKYLWGGGVTKYATAARDTNTGETYDIVLKDGNTYDEYGNPVSIVRGPDTVITPHTLALYMDAKAQLARPLEKPLESVYPEFDIITGAGLAKDLGVWTLSKLGNNWTKNRILGNAFKYSTLEDPISEPLSPKIINWEYGPILSERYYKPWRSSWSGGELKGNAATSYYFKNLPSEKFELVNDLEPYKQSIHFKTTLGVLPYGKKMTLFAKVADEVPDLYTISTHGNISKGGIHGLERFGKDFGFMKHGTVEIADKAGNPVTISEFLKPLNPFRQYSTKALKEWADELLRAKQLLHTHFDYDGISTHPLPYLESPYGGRYSYLMVESPIARQYYEKVILPKFLANNIEVTDVPHTSKATTLDDYIMGSYNPVKNESYIDLLLSNDPVPTFIHENYSHGTDKAIPKSMQTKYPTIPKEVTSNVNGRTYNLASHDWEESRATINELRYKYPTMDWSKISDEDLAWELRRMNSYGYDYSHYINTTPNPMRKEFLNKLRYALINLPMAATPIVINNSNNNEGSN